MLLLHKLVIKKKLVGFLSVLSCLVFIISSSTGVIALTAGDIQSITGYTPFFDPSSICSSGSSGAGLSSGSVYILGDSITVRAQSQYTSTFQSKGITANIDAQVGRGLTSAGTPSENPGVGNLTSGMQAIGLDKANITSAGAIIVALGTNGGDTTQNIDNAITALRADNPNAPIYWVNTITVDRSDNYNETTIGPANTAIASQASVKNYSVINWFNTVDPTGTPEQPTQEETDPNSYIALGDGVNAHPTPAGITALVNLVAGAVTSGSSTSSSAGSSSSDCSCGTATTLVGGDTEQEAFNYFVQKGLNATQAAAVVGNLMDESHMDPTIMQIGGDSQDPNNAGSEGWGIAQWTPGAKVIGIAAGLNITGPIYDLGTQLDIVWGEMTGSSPVGYTNLAKALEQINDLATATTFFQTDFEVGVAGSRQTDAQQAFQLYGGTTGNSGTSSAGQSSGGCSGITCTPSSTTPTGNTSSLSQTRQNIVCQAQQELSTWENQPNYNSPYPKFTYAATGFLKYTDNNYEEWCADFASWIYNAAGDPFSGGSSGGWRLPAVASIHDLGLQNQKFQWHSENSGYTPQPGDLALYYDASQSNPWAHVNIFISSTGGQSTYIGGDQGGVDQPDGTYGTKNPPSGSIVSKAVFPGYYSQGIAGYVSPN